MLANQMRNRTEVELDRVSNFSSPGYTDSEYSDILTKAQWQYIKSIISKKANQKAEAFDETEVRKQGLAGLIKDSTDTASTGTVASTDQSGVLTNGRFFDLPSDFLWAVTEEVTTGTNDCTATATGAVPKVKADVDVITYDEYRRYLGNQYRQPYLTNNEGLVWRLVYSRDISGYDNATQATQTRKRHEIITDGTFTADSYRLRYIKVPNNIVVDTVTTTNQRHCELDESVQETIVDIAVDMLKEVSERQDVKNLQPLNTLE